MNGGFTRASGCHPVACIRATNCWALPRFSRSGVRPQNLYSNKFPDGADTSWAGDHTRKIAKRQSSAAPSPPSSFLAGSGQV